MKKWKYQFTALLVVILFTFIYAEGDYKFSYMMEIRQNEDLSVYNEYPIFNESWINELAGNLDASFDEINFQFKKDKEECEEADICSYLQSFSHQKVSVNYSSPMLLVLEHRNIYYTGGAHGNSYINYKNIDLINKKVLLLDDLFSSQEQKYLLVLLEKKFREIHEIDQDEDLCNSFFGFNDGFKFPLEFEIEPHNLMFYYNTYEVASYAQGPTKIIIPYDELNNLLDHNEESRFIQFYTINGLDKRAGLP